MYARSFLCTYASAYVCMHVCMYCMYVLYVLERTISFIRAESPCYHVHGPLSTTTTIIMEEEAVDEVVQRQCFSQDREVGDALRRGVVPKGRNLRSRKCEESYMYFKKHGHSYYAIASMYVCMYE